MSFKVGDRVEFVADKFSVKKGSIDIVVSCDINKSRWVWLESFKSCDPRWIRLKPLTKLEKAMK